MAFGHRALSRGSLLGLRPRFRQLAQEKAVADDESPRVHLAAIQFAVIDRRWIGVLNSKIRVVRVPAQAASNVRLGGDIA